MWFKIENPLGGNVVLGEDFRDFFFIILNGKIIYRITTTDNSFESWKYHRVLKLRKI